MKYRLVLLLAVIGVLVLSGAAQAQSAEKTTVVDRTEEDTSEVWIDFIEDPESTDNASIGEIENDSDSYVFGSAIPELFGSGDQSAVFVGSRTDGADRIDGEVYTTTLSSEDFGNNSGTTTGPTELPEIESINAKADFDLNLDGELENIANSLSQADYNPGSHPGLTFRTEDPVATVLIYESGEALVSGPESPQEVDKAFLEVSASLIDLGYEISENPEIELLNIVGSTDIDQSLYDYITDLDPDKVERTPTESPWAVYYSEGVTGETTLLLFENGEAAISGAEIPDDLPESRNELTSDIDDPIDTEFSWEFDAPETAPVGESIELELHVTNTGETGVGIAEIYEDTAFVNGTQILDRNKIGPVEVEAGETVTEVVEIEAPEAEASTILSLETQDSVFDTETVDIVEGTSTGVVVECPEDDINCESNPPGLGIGPDATVEWYSGGSEVASASTNSTGFFDVPEELEQGSEYTGTDKNR